MLMDITQEHKMVYSNINNTFVACLEDDKIYQLNTFTNQKAQIGFSAKAYKELQEICDKYYSKLVEVGVIVPPKTPEEIQAEQQKAMSELLQVVQQLKTEVEVLKNGHQASIEHSQREAGDAN